MQVRDGEDWRGTPQTGGLTVPRIVARPPVLKTYHRQTVVSSPEPPNPFKFPTGIPTIPPEIAPAGTTLLHQAPVRDFCAHFAEIRLAQGRSEYSLGLWTPPPDLPLHAELDLSVRHWFGV